MAYTYDWPRAALCADTAVFHIPKHSIDRSEWSVLLILRGEEPYKGMWGIPGGHLDMNETLLQCALRELVEETGLELPNANFVNYKDAVNRDDNKRAIMMVFTAVVSSKFPIDAKDDAEAVSWTPVLTALDMDLAADHNAVIQECLDWMTNNPSGRGYVL